LSTDAQIVDDYGLITAATAMGAKTYTVYQTGYYWVPPRSGIINVHSHHAEPVEGCGLPWPRRFTDNELVLAYENITKHNFTDSTLRSFYNLKVGGQAAAFRSKVLQHREGKCAAVAAAAAAATGVPTTSQPNRRRKARGTNGVPETLLLLRERGDALVLVMYHKTVAGAVPDEKNPLVLVSLEVGGNMYDVSDMYIDHAREVDEGMPWSFAWAITYGADGAAAPPEYGGNFKKKDPKIWQEGELHPQAIIWALRGEVERSIPCMEWSDFDATFCTTRNGWKLFHLVRIDAENHIVVALHGYLSREKEAAVKFFYGFSNLLVFGAALNGCKASCTDGSFVEIDTVETLASLFGGSDDHKRLRCIWHCISKEFTIVYGRHKSYDGGVGRTALDWVMKIVKETETRPEVDAAFKNLKAWLRTAEPRPSDRRRTDKAMACARSTQSQGPVKTAAKLNRTAAAPGGGGGKIPGPPPILEDSADAEPPDWEIGMFVCTIGANCIRVNIKGHPHTRDLVLDRASLSGWLDADEFQQLEAEMTSSARTAADSDVPPIGVNGANTGALMPGADENAFQIERFVQIDGASAMKVARVRWVGCDYRSDTMELWGSLKRDLGDEQLQTFETGYKSRSQHQKECDDALEPVPVHDDMTGAMTAGLTMVQKQLLLQFVSARHDEAMMTCAGCRPLVRDLGKGTTHSESSFGAAKTDQNVSKHSNLSKTMGALLAKSTEQTKKWNEKATELLSRRQLGAVPAGARATAQGGGTPLESLLTRKGQSLLTDQVNRAAGYTVKAPFGPGPWGVEPNVPVPEVLPGNVPWGPWRRERTVRRVAEGSGRVILLCSCTYWARYGIPCRHIIAVAGGPPPNTIEHIDIRWFALVYTGRLNKFLWERRLLPGQALTKGPTAWAVVGNLGAAGGLFAVGDVPPPGPDGMVVPKLPVRGAAPAAARSSSHATSYRAIESGLSGLAQELWVVEQHNPGVSMEFMCQIQQLLAQLTQVSVPHTPSGYDPLTGEHTAPLQAKEVSKAKRHKHQGEGRAAAPTATPTSSIRQRGANFGAAGSAASAALRSQEMRALALDAAVKEPDHFEFNLAERHMGGGNQETPAHERRRIGEELRLETAKMVAASEITPINGLGSK
jgi:hypothetical protein